MGYRLRVQEDVFSHKVDDGERSAWIFTPGCNFDCEFCGHRANPGAKPESSPELSRATIAEEIDRVLRINRSVKINGGETTLDPERLRFLSSTVKERGGEVIVDTNGSMPQNLLPIVRDGLVDQVEVGFKGLTGGEAIRRSRTGDLELAWNRPLALVRAISEERPKVRVLPTFVVTTSNTDDEFRSAFNMFSDLQGEIYIRINNIFDPYPHQDVFDYYYNGMLKTDSSITEMPREVFDIMVRRVLEEKYFKGVNLTPIPEDELEERFRKLVEEMPRWKGRVILVPNVVAKDMPGQLIKL